MTTIRQCFDFLAFPTTLKNNIDSIIDTENLYRYSIILTYIDINIKILRPLRYHYQVFCNSINFISKILQNEHNNKIHS